MNIERISHVINMCDLGGFKQNFSFNKGTIIWSIDIYHSSKYIKKNPP